MRSRTREAALIVAVLALSAIAVGTAVAIPPPEGDVPPFLQSPEPGIFDTLPGPYTDPRSFNDIDILVPSAQPPGPPVLEASGTLEDVGPREIRVHRGPSQPDMLIELGPGTALYLDGEQASWRALPSGADVRVVYELDGNERVARRIEASVPGATSESPPPRR